MGKHLSPTNVATYYHNQCHLYLHNAFHRPHDIAATSRDASPLAAAQFHRGLEWEARLFRLLEVSNQLVRLDPASEPKTAVQIRDLILGIGSTLSEGNARYVVNLVFQSPSFKQELTSAKSNPTLVAFGLAKPDIVKIMRVDKNQISWEIIDAKSSSALKSSHNAQIGFYHLCLENLIASVAQKGKNVLQIIPSNQASIWLPGSEEDDELSKPVSTPISLLLPPLRTFLFKTLPQVLKLPRDQVEWHLNPSCQGCEFFTSCKQATIEDGRLGLIPNLSVSEARFIREVMGIAVEQGFMPASTGQLTDIEEMDSLVKNNGIERLEKTYTPTAKRFQRLLGVQRTSTRRWSPLLEAAKTHEPQVCNSNWVPHWANLSTSSLLDNVYSHFLAAKNSHCTFLSSSMSAVTPWGRFVSPALHSRTNQVVGVWPISMMAPKISYQAWPNYSGNGSNMIRKPVRRYIHTLLQSVR